MATDADIADARIELDLARAMVDDWKQRGAPPFEQATLMARLAAAEAAVATAIGPAVQAQAHAPTWGQREVGPFALPPSPTASKSPRARASHAPQRAPGPATDHDVLLNRETDARFWAQTGYKPGQKLDDKNPTDKAMIKAWLDIHAKVLREDAAGQLVITYNNPALGDHLAAAEAAGKAAAQHLDAAAAAPDPATMQEHVQAATAAIATSQQRAQQAAALQPPTVSPAVVKAASHDAHAAAALPPPNVKILPDQRGRWHPNAAPAEPAFAHPSIPDKVTPPQTAEDHVALAQAAAAPDVAGAVHDAAATEGIKSAVFKPVAKQDEGSSAGSVAAVIAAVAASAGLIILARRGR